MELSIVIPTFNEAAGIKKLLLYLQQHLTPNAEIVVADGGSTDQTASIAQATGATVVHCPRRGRAAQLNAGAAAATGEVLYFLHADTYPPSGFGQQIILAVAQGFRCGCFRLQFDDAHWFLKVNAWFTRFDVDAVRFGDQSLFVAREVFYKAGCFDEAHLLLEDQEIIKRLKKNSPFKVLPAAVRTSARKYKQYGVLRLQGIYYVIYTLYRLKLPQHQLVELYKRLLP